MPLVGEEMWVSAWNVRRQPFAVRKGSEPILRTLPDRHGDLGVSEVEAPWPHEGEFIVLPAPKTIAHRVPEDLRQPGRGFTSDRRAVDVRDQIAEPCRHLVGGDGGERRADPLKELVYCGVTGYGRAETRDVLLTHAGHPV